MKFTGAQIIIRLLEEEGIRFIAGIPGGSNLPLYDALHKSRRIRHILTRHEQGAGFIAQGMARSTGKPAVCFATSGPGATNLLTAIADAKLDSVPVIAITGQVPTALLGTDAFQEVDTYGMSFPITKHNYLVKSAQELLTVIPQAFEIAASGRPGPVLIDIPKDVQQQTLEIGRWPQRQHLAERHRIGMRDLRKLAQMINTARAPVMYIGGGIVHSSSHEQVAELAKKNSIPVAMTLMGLGAFPADEPLSLGMLGMHGSRATNLLLHEADLLLAFGVRFDDRATGNVKKFCPRAGIAHVDIDPAEIDKIKKSDLSLTADIGQVLRQLTPLVRADHRRAWVGRMRQLQKRYPFPEFGKKDALHPLRLIHAVSTMVSADTVITTDVGQHQMWTAQGYPFRQPRTFLTSGGLGTMGFGLPAAIGAALAHPGKRTVCISGDGSILMNIQELATLAELGLAVTVVVMNNSHLGLVRQQQELFYGGNYIASRFPLKHDFAGIARAFGIKSYAPHNGREAMAMLRRSLAGTGPSLIDMPISATENVFPMVPPGASNEQMLGDS